MNPSTSFKGQSENRNQNDSSLLRIRRDDLFHLLQSSRRRATVRYLFEQETNGPSEIRDIAETVAAWENNTSIDGLSYKERQRVYISLYQSHLPKLHDHGIIDYDQSRGRTELRALATLLQPFLGDELDAATADDVEPPNVVPE